MNRYIASFSIGGLLSLVGYPIFTKEGFSATNLLILVFVVLIVVSIIDSNEKK